MQKVKMVKGRKLTNATHSEESGLKEWLLGLAMACKLRARVRDDEKNWSYYPHPMWEESSNFGTKSTKSTLLSPSTTKSVHEWKMGEYLLLYINKYIKMKLFGRILINQNSNSRNSTVLFCLI